MKIGVIIGRFQVPRLTTGHEWLLSTVSQRSDKLIIMLGVAPFTSTRNPLSYTERARMLRGWSQDILPIEDAPTNEAWSKAIDYKLNTMFWNHHEITLYHARDGFGSAYSGKYPVVELVSPISFSGTDVRNSIDEAWYSGEHFRAGIIYHERTRFKAPTPCVDIAFMQGGYVLLGRKANEVEWRLPGGVVDNADPDYEFSARRELFEETGLTAEGKLSYVGTFKVEDWRNRDGDSAIFTTLFTGQYTFGKPIAQDDLFEVEWFRLNEAHVAVMQGHKQLIGAIIKLYE